MQRIPHYKLGIAMQIDKEIDKIDAVIGYAGLRISEEDADGYIVKLSPRNNYYDDDIDARMKLVNGECVHKIREALTSYRAALISELELLGVKYVEDDEDE